MKNLGFTHFIPENENEKNRFLQMEMEMEKSVFSFNFKWFTNYLEIPKPFGDSMVKNKPFKIISKKTLKFINK